MNEPLIQTTITLTEVERFENDEVLKNKLLSQMAERWYAKDNTWFYDRPEHIQTLMRQYPSWGYYRIKNCNKPCRIIGFHEIEGGKTTVQTYVPMKGSPDWFNETLGGRPVEDIEKLDKWTKEDLNFISSYDLEIQLILRHPFGYFELAEDN